MKRLLRPKDLIGYRERLRQPDGRTITVSTMPTDTPERDQKDAEALYDAGLCLYCWQPLLPKCWCDD